MPRQKKTATNLISSRADENAVPLVWLKARYELHTFSYRDPRSAFSAATALPVLSPTAVLLGICSTLHQLGRSQEAGHFLRILDHCRVKVDPPDGAVFFRAFHQLRRYARETSKAKGKPPKPNIGLTEINQGTREYGLLQGPIDVYVGVPENNREAAAMALRNRDHMGTHDSLCSLVDDVEEVAEPVGVLYEPLVKGAVSVPQTQSAAVVTLSRFRSSDFGSEALQHWKMSGGENTELVPFLILGAFRGTRNGKIYTKRPFAAHSSRHEE